MTDEPQDKLAKPQASLSQEVGAKAARKLKARRNAGQGVWFGLGMMGLIGWSVVIPTLLGAALGIWLDKHYPGKHAWTLALLVAGLAIGCLNAWHWVAKEDKEIGTNRRITMNEFLFWRRRWWRAWCSARFSSAASGGRLSGAFRPNGRRFGSSAACCCGRALPWRDFILSGARIGSGWLLCLLGFILARLVVKWLTRPPVEHHNAPATETSHAP